MGNVNDDDNVNDKTLFERQKEKTKEEEEEEEIKAVILTLICI